MAKKTYQELDRACVYCENASLLQDKDYVLCSKRGIVGAGFLCRSFSYDPLKRIPMPRKQLESDIELSELP